LAGQKGLIGRVLIRVQRDGLITRRTLDKPSGNALMDTSVMNAVESVKQLQSLPPGFGSSYKDITIDFALTETPLGE
jgi:TonB family protein